MKTVRLTMAQALVRFLDNQYVERDGTRTKFVHGVFAVFGHGNVVGLGEALVEMDHGLEVYQGHNEQGMAHAATAFAKQKNRLQICAATSSIGPGAMNMVTAAATATVNRIPVLLLPGDAFACRQPDPVLQQVEHRTDPNLTANDAFRAVSAYWDRVSRPDQLMTAARNAMRTLTDPAETGAVTLSLPQDVQGEAYDYPESFFAEYTWHIDRQPPAERALAQVADAIASAKKPLVIAGGGVRYSDAGEALEAFCEQTGIPFAETQAGKGTIAWDHRLNLGGIGVTGGLAANRIAAQADIVIAVGTRLGDFTTASKSAFANPDAGIVSINVNAFDAHKMAAEPMLCDARVGLEALRARLEETSYRSGYGDELASAQAEWRAEVDRLYGGGDPEPFGAAAATEGGGAASGARATGGPLLQTRVLGLLNEELLPQDAVVVGSSGSLPGDMQRLWRTRRMHGYHMEYGFSCMGYEISGAFGARLAQPDREVIAMTGDGSYIMLHSELVTAIREGVRFIVVVFDNTGYQCIDNLQTSQGISSYATYFRTRDAGGKLTGPTPVFDFAANAKAYGATVWSVRTEDELRTAVAGALEARGPAVIDVKVADKSMTGGYESWWRVGVPEVSSRDEVVSAHAEMREQIEKARPW
ncbi:MAG: 3D-(3,5/4)-trihydroxycyclohexane-1,2-dione acylhydrolase (decyclizing) [Spirochaetota bacterium]